MRNIGMIIVALLVLPLVTFAADTVTPVGGSGTWYNWTVPSGTRTAGFWDGPSWDGQNCNIGFWLLGTQGTCSNSSGGFLFPTPAAPLDFLASSSSPKAPVMFTMTPTGATNRATTFHLEVALNKSMNEFGYYLLSAPDTLNTLFTGGQTAGATNMFTATQPFGFYLKGPGGTFKSGSTYNFVLFAQNPADPAGTQTNQLTKYVVGTEDLPTQTTLPWPNGYLSQTDADYNDIVVSIESVGDPNDPGGSGCTYTIGGYKNKYKGLIVSLTLGTVNYSPTQILAILNEPVRGNGLVSLAHQLIAAELNIANGATPSQDVMTAIADAHAAIGGKVIPPYGSGYLAPGSVGAISSTLDAFNNGLLGPRHCE